MSALLEGSGTLRVIATSREPLAIPGETVVAVPPLAITRRRGAVHRAYGPRLVREGVRRSPARDDRPDLRSPGRPAAGHRACRREDEQPVRRPDRRRPRRSRSAAVANRRRGAGAPAHDASVIRVEPMTCSPTPKPGCSRTFPSSEEASASTMRSRSAPAPPSRRSHRSWSAASCPSPRFRVAAGAVIRATGCSRRSVSSRPSAWRPGRANTGPAVASCSTTWTRRGNQINLGGVDQDEWMATLESGSTTCVRR